MAWAVTQRHYEAIPIPPKPQPETEETVRDTLHHMMLMGVIDPVPTAASKWEEILPFLQLRLVEKMSG